MKTISAVSIHLKIETADFLFVVSEVVNDVFDFMDVAEIGREAQSVILVTLSGKMIAAMWANSSNFAAD